jgi:TolA-binding protein
MQRLTVLVLLVLAGLAWHGHASASGDFACYPSWMLEHRELPDCNNMAMLQPGNDTRVNLMMLMNDLRAGKAETVPAAPGAQDALVDLDTFGAGSVLPPKAGESDASGNSGGDASGDDGNYAEGEGSRCRSNPAGTAAFEAAVKAAALPDNEKSLLIEARKGLQPNCTSTSGGADGVAKAAQQVTAPLSKSFAAYLQAAQAFYDGDYDTAAARFRELSAVDQPWLGETARYMLGRVEVNRAQVNAFDEYGNPQQNAAVDPEVIDGAEAALQDYLKVYPRGAYAASARGLLRRVYWLGKETDKLAAAYATALAGDAAARGMNDVDFANEVDSKLLVGAGPTNVNDPTLLAVLDLAGMRGPNPGDDPDCCGTPMARATLEAQRASFSAEPALFDYLLAAYTFYVENKPDAIPQMIPEAKEQPASSYLEFSRQMLRGMALEALKDSAARDHWAAMLPGATLPFQNAALELALAVHDERDHAIDRVFAADSPVRNATLREILLTNVADAKLLRRQSADSSLPERERGVALFTLLYKEVSRGHYADFVKDISLVPAGAPTDGYAANISGNDQAPPPLGLFTQTTALGDYGCGALKDTASHLARSPHDSKAQLCLADFMRVNGFDESALDTQPGAKELGGTLSLFGGAPYSRQAVYRTLIAGAKTPAPDKAYALYRAVMCYGPSGDNSCGGEDVPQSQRKAWFLQLKKDYPKSRWAKELQYYW